MRALILSPHPDDAELGCGGTIVRLRSDYHDVLVARFSDCPIGQDPDVLRVESGYAANTLDAEERWFEIPALPPHITAMELSDGRVLTPEDVFTVPNRMFPKFRQEILDWLIKLRDEYKPTHVFAPSSCDTHQDHATVHQEAVRAFRRVTLYGYELPWNSVRFDARHFVGLTTPELDRKCKALAHFESQAERSYVHEDYVRSWARYRGQQIGVTHAEAFEVIRSIE